MVKAAETVALSLGLIPPLVKSEMVQLQPGSTVLISIV